MKRDCYFGDVNNMKTENTDPLTGITLLTGLAILTFGLFTQDTSILFFAIPIIFALLVANSRGNKDIDDNIRSIGITGTNIKTAIPIGIAAGLFCFILGNLIIGLTSKVTSSTVPTFAIPLSEASFIPAQMFLATNILIQFLIVAPAEELGFRFLSPYIINSFIKSAPIAMLGGTLLWVFTHIPAYTLQSTPLSMYIVLLVIGLIAIGLIYYTQSLITPWIMHGTFNTLVLVIGGVLSVYVYLMLIFIACSLIFLYLSGGGKHGKKTQSEFNL